MCVPEVEAPVMTSVKVVPDDSQFAAGENYLNFSPLSKPFSPTIFHLPELEAADSKLVVVDLSHCWRRLGHMLSVCLDLVWSVSRDWREDRSCCFS